MCRINRWDTRIHLLVGNWAPPFTGLNLCYNSLLSGLDFNLTKKSFQIMSQFELIFVPQLLPTSTMPYSYIYCCTYHNLIYIDYLYICGIPIRYQFNSTKCTGHQSCASHATECWYCELCRVSSLVLFNGLSPIFLSIVTHQCVHWLWWD